MRLLERITTLVRADAHGVVERLEERGLLVRQHLRDAELALGEDRARLDALGEEAERLDEETRRREASVADLDADVALALAREESGLARFACRRLLAERAALGTTARRAQALGVERARLEARVEAREEELQALRERARALLARTRREEAPAPDRAPAAGISEEEVDLELLRRREAKVSGTPPAAPGSAAVAAREEPS
jgi:phage shock protein A